MTVQIRVITTKNERFEIREEIADENDTQQDKTLFNCIVWGIPLVLLLMNQL